MIANKEFEGIYDAEHPECTGERFASLEGDRMLRIECSDPEGARYSLDDSSQLIDYHSPVRIDGAESVLAFCGEEFNLLSHPQRRPELAERANGRRHGGGGTQPSVMVFMIDATSRAHFRRSMPVAAPPHCMRSPYAEQQPGQAFPTRSDCLSSDHPCSPHLIEQSLPPAPPRTRPAAHSPHRTLASPPA